MERHSEMIERMAHAAFSKWCDVEFAATGKVGLRCAWDDEGVQDRWRCVVVAALAGAQSAGCQMVPIEPGSEMQRIADKDADENFLSWWRIMLANAWRDMGTADPREAAREPV